MLLLNCSKNKTNRLFKRYEENFEDKYNVKRTSSNNSNVKEARSLIDKKFRRYHGKF